MKTTHSIQILLLLLLTPFFVSAQDASLSEAKKKADQLYQEGKYQEAVKGYEQIVAGGYESFELYYNLGNALYKSGNITYSILNYERALKLSPGNDDALYNLEMAKRLVVDNIDVLPEPGFLRWWHNYTSSRPADSWAWHSIIAFFLFLSLFGLYLLAKAVQIKKFAFWFALLAFTYSVIAFGSGVSQKNHLIRHDSGVITDRSVRMKGSPSETGTELYIIHEGLTVSITDKLGEWIEIRLADGSKGWIKESALIRI